MADQNKTDTEAKFFSEILRCVVVSGAKYQYTNRRGSKKLSTFPRPVAVCRTLSVVRALERFPRSHGGARFSELLVGEVFRL